jgi:hypothetical protein
VTLATEAPSGLTVHNVLRGIVTSVAVDGTRILARSREMRSRDSASSKACRCRR